MTRSCAHVSIFSIRVHCSHFQAHPKYEFEYKVHDPHTGDIKEQKEHRDGDVVKGFYSLKEADGTTREVHYHSDKHSGFNAEVKKIGHAYHGHEYHGHGYP
ncbi:unnamed protein product [Nesidiocoris tenuis]|uniref:Uncharacterized protein n=1 Tax=Nesidiocoris tenuis TaxID=355587 RepID=A0A6H5GQV5_9HEMI|nr:unnamed protein product [Nesidiocoris tenuis]